MNFSGMTPGALVLLHLVDPNEKYWGVLQDLGMAGITVRAVNLSSLDDWMRSLSYEEEEGLGAATLFFPLRRIERMSLDEPIGQIESLAQIFERRVGRSLQEVLGMIPEAPETTH